MPPPHTSAVAPAPNAASNGLVSWRIAAWQRLRCHAVLKTLGVCGFMWVFFTAYFYLLRQPASGVTVMPLTAFDSAVPFNPHALWPYVSLWVYVSLPAALLSTLRQLLAYGAWVGALCAIGLLCFYVYPTAVPAMVLPVDVAKYPGFAVLQGVDESGNAFPSLHVATAVFSACWIHHLLHRLGAPARLRGLSGVWVLLIVWSTLATKQHVLLDALAGAALGLSVAWTSLRWWRRQPGLHGSTGG